jgi:MFS family permease
MGAALRSTWALLLGVGLLMLGHGLQGTLLPVRANLEQFGTTVTGLVMSGYFVGLLIGSLLTPHLVAHVGHVRVFAALVSLASTTILFHALFVEPVAWFLMRFLTGICLCGVYIVAESWLNAKVTNDSRGALFSVYMIVQLGGVAAGQFLLTLADPRAGVLFMVVSVLVSLSVMPLLLTATPAPEIQPHRSFGLFRLYQVSPLGVVGIAGIGLGQSALYAMGPVYADDLGLGAAGISTFMALAILGGVVLQFPLGRLSDRFDRRSVITLVTILAGLSLTGAVVSTQLRAPVLFATFFALGGLSLPLYSLCVAHINDFLSPDEMVGASSALLLANAAGCVLGPTLVALFMTGLGSRGFPLYLAIVHLAIGVFALWRMTRRSALPLEAQGPTVFISASAAASPVATAVVQAERQQREPEAEPALEPS